nr:probable manganese-transporting ATPase PDR2 [Tanacetum cinerariifolium]
PEEDLSYKRDKKHVLFRGTRILHHEPDMTFHIKAPDAGCIAIVLRTGFKTNQGKLIRTCLFSREKVTAKSWERGLFSLLLLFSAIIAVAHLFEKEALYADLLGVTVPEQVVIKNPKKSSNKGSKRRKSATEIVKAKKKPRTTRKVPFKHRTCSKCGEKGHNRRKCTGKKVMKEDEIQDFDEVYESDEDTTSGEYNSSDEDTSADVESDED